MPPRFDVERLVGAVERRHRPILAAALLLLVLSALSLVRLRLDMDILAQLPASAAFRDYRAFLQKFAVFDSLIILATGPPARLVPFVDALGEKLAEIPEVGTVRYRVDLEEVRRKFLAPYRYQLLPGDAFDELARRLEPAAIEERVRGLRRALAMPMSLGARRWIVDDPLGVDELVGRGIEGRYADPLMRPSGEYFVSADGGAALLIARPLRSAFDTIFTERMLGAVHEAERKLTAGPFPDVSVGHTGSYVYALDDKRVIQSDMRIYFVFAPLAVLAIFHLALRTLRILPFATFPLLLTTTLTFALSLLCFGSLSMISVAFAGIFYGLGVDSAIYFYGLLRDKAARQAELDRAGVRAAVVATLSEIGAANVVASVTTAVAFFVIGLSDFTGVSELGLMTGIAMLLNIVATFVLLPAMVFVWGPRGIPPPRRSRVAPWFGRLAVALADRRRAVLVGATCLMVAAALGLPRVRLDTEFTHLRPGSGEAERVERTIAERFHRVDAQGIAMVHGRDADDALSATERVAAELERYRGEGLVSSYSALTAFVPSAQTASRRLERFRALPRRQAAQTLRAALSAAGFDIRPFEGFLEDLVRDERPRIRVDEQVQGPLAGLVEQHLRRTDDGTLLVTYFVPAPGVSLSAVGSRLLADLPGLSITVTGREIVESEFARLLERELVWFLAGALALNFIVVMLAERSFVRSLAVLSPTLAALTLYLGLIGALDVPIDPVNLIVLPLLIGLGVDDTVYLLAHVRYGGGLEAGVRRGVVALLLAVGTTVAGFGSLGLSRFPALSRLGSLAALGLTLCLATALLLVPALLDVLGGRRSAQDSDGARTTPAPRQVSPST